MIVKKAVKLTDEQRKIVEANHDFIDNFLNKYLYDIEEFYDLAAIGLCEAVSTYKGKCNRDDNYFLNYVEDCIFNEICEYKEKFSDDAMNHLERI